MKKLVVILKEEGIEKKIGKDASIAIYNTTIRELYGKPITIITDHGKCDAEEPDSKHFRKYMLDKEYLSSYFLIPENYTVIMEKPLE